MKKNEPQRFYRLLLWAMKIQLLIILLICSASILVFADTYAQSPLDKTVSIDLRNALLKDALDKVSKNTGVKFLYSDEVAKSQIKITSHAKSVSIGKWLDDALASYPFTYSVIDNAIIIRYEQNKTKKKTVSTELPPSTPDPIKISGKVLDDNGQPLAGASVKVKGGLLMTSTDERGQFHFDKLKINDVLVVSFVGYKQKEFVISSDKDIVISLEADISNLSEVVVIPYGSTTQKLNTGAISVVTSKDIENQPIANPIEALEGRVPGLFITQSSGLPGSAYNLSIRGRTSIENSSDPLYLIDGVPFNSTSLDLINYGYFTTGENPLSSISPSDIESIEVLKDAAATAIYGSRGANGVVLITTKKGKVGKTKVSASAYTGNSVTTRTENLLNTSQYLAMRHEAFKNDGVTPDASTAPDLYSWDTTRYINWKKLLIGGTAHTTDAQASISGGNDLTQFLVGANYHRQTTVYPGDFADKRASVHFNLTHSSADKKFSLSLSASYSDETNNLPSADLTQYINLPPDAPEPYNAYGKLNWSENGTSYYNPLGYLYQTYTGNTSSLVSNAVLEYKILPQLSARVNLGYTNTALTQTEEFPISSQNPDVGPVSSAIFGNNSSKTWIIEPQAEYKKQFKKHSIDVLIGSSWEQDLTNGILTNASNYSNDALLGSPSAAGTVTATSNYTQYRYDAIFGRISYNYDEQYLLDITGRRDGSTRFGPGRQFADFGAVGASWIFTENNWAKNNLLFISFGKLRASYGTTGNDKIGDYKYLSTYYSTYSPYQGTSGLIPNNLSNPEYAWEINKKIEAALDLGFFKDRLMVTVDYFRNRTNNELINYTLPAQTGFTSILENFPAVVENKGWEFQINSTNVNGNNFKWTSSFNLSIDRNKLVSFPGLATSSYAQQYVIGQPLNIRKLLQYTGVDPSTGIYQFNGTTLPTDETAVVSTDPKFYGGLQNTFTYHRLQLTAFFQFVKQIARNYYAGLSSGNAPGTMYNLPDFVLSRWQKAGDISPVQKFTAGGTDASTAYYYYSYFSTASYSDASFIRLKNVSVSYSLSDNWVKKIGASNARIYLRGENLLTITSYKGGDPETGSVNNDNLPLLKTMTIGLQVNY